MKPWSPEFKPQYNQKKKKKVRPHFWALQSLTEVSQFKNTHHKYKFSSLEAISSYIFILTCHFWNIYVINSVSKQCTIYKMRRFYSFLSWTQKKNHLFMYPLFTAQFPHTASLEIQASMSWAVLLGRRANSDWEINPATSLWGQGPQRSISRDCCTERKVRKAP
jgi:hypothetical protein